METCFSYDRFELPEQSQRVIDENNFLSAPAAIARVGVQTYRARDIFTSDGQSAFPLKKPDETVKMFRPADEVGAADAIKSFEHAPVTLGHPDPIAYPAGVTADCWSQLAKGHASDCSFDRKAGLVKATLHVRDAKAVDAINKGVQQLSAGYRYAIDRTPGIDPDTGEAYDAVQRKIRANHIAIVPSGRGGPSCRVADEDTQPKEAKMKRTVQFKGVAYSLDETEASLVETLVKDLATSQDALTTAQSAHGEAVAKLATEHAAKVKELEAKIVTTEQLAAMVQDHATVLSDCARLCPKVKPEGSAGVVRRAMLADITGRDEHAKRVADAVLVGVALDKADDATVQVALRTVIAASANDENTARREQQARNLANPTVVGQKKISAKSDDASDVEEVSVEAATRKQNNRWQEKRQ